MILSATIDEDEPAFNKFFSTINKYRVHETIIPRVVPVEG
jgi:hypothetical protein